MPPAIKPIFIRIFSKRSPVDTPLEPESRSRPPTDDWVWNALSIARQAAMAEDLAHHPSIPRIANIFTQMLEQLQGMKRNKDEFHEITKDIGSLIESVVQYARHHGSMPGLSRLCDEFLSTISSIQSEMEQRFGALTKRSAKARAYQDVLSSCQFRVKRLRYDLEALTPSSPLPPSPGLFSNASKFVISGGTFTDVQRDHIEYNIYGYGTDIQTLLTGRMKDLNVSDYRIFKYGDLEAISPPQRGITFNGDVQDSTIVRLDNQIKTARTYRGTDAFQSFKNDLRIIQEQKFRHPQFLQLFGVCLSDNVPTLIFHGDLTPVFAIDTHTDARNALAHKFQMLRQWQAACRYLMGMDNQFIDILARHMNGVYSEVYRSDCSWNLFLDNNQQLQVLIKSPSYLSFKTLYFIPPMLSPHDTEAIETILSHGSIPDKSCIDKQKWLLVIYRILMKKYCGYGELRDTTILVSPMKQARAARYTFDHGFRFKWSGWFFQNGLNGPQVEMSRVNINGDSLTRFTIAPNVSEVENHTKSAMIVTIRSYFKPPSQYIETWLAQAERIKSQIRSSFGGSCEDLVLVRGGYRDISFQPYFYPSLHLQELEPIFLFVRDLQELDDLFEIKWFWAKDPKGLECLDQANMLLLGLDEPRQSDQVRLYLRRASSPTLWKELQIFHEFFGFPADSPDIPHFLNLPVASLQWDGDEKGPLTPQELITTNGRFYDLEDGDEYQHPNIRYCLWSRTHQSSADCC